MLAVACACLFTLGVLLFLLGMAFGRLAVASLDTAGSRAAAATLVGPPAASEH